MCFSCKRLTHNNYQHNEISHVIEEDGENSIYVSNNIARGGDRSRQQKMKNNEKPT